MMTTSLVLPAAILPIGTAADLEVLTLESRLLADIQRQYGSLVGGADLLVSVIRGVSAGTQSRFYSSANFRHSSSAR